MVQLSHPYMTTGKTIALTRQTFVGKVMSLLFSMSSRLVIAFLPRSKQFLISWLQLPSAVILEPRKRKSVTVSTFFPIYLPWSVGPDVMILVFEGWILSQLFHSHLSLSSRGFLVPLRWWDSGNSGQTLFFWAPKSLQMVTTAMKLKDAYSLEGKLWPT